MQPYNSSAPVSRKQSRKRAEEAGRVCQPQRNNILECGVKAPLPAVKSKTVQHCIASKNSIKLKHDAAFQISNYLCGCYSPIRPGTVMSRKWYSTNL
ncbi:hypothetical protein CHISP_2748 [Chitinispirillum alkaliphilum]|nr:hypothetical protein CHISP_2748 [Chitinispirillum alkaliphilum]